MKLIPYDILASDFSNGVHHLVGMSHTLKAALTNRTPDKDLDRTFANVIEIASRNGYPRGGFEVGNFGVPVDGAIIVNGKGFGFEAKGGSVGPFSCVVLYNDTPFSPLRPLIGYWPLAQEVTLKIAETFEFQISDFAIKVQIQ